MLIVDTGAVLSRLWPEERPAVIVDRFLKAERHTPILPATVAAELDYMLNHRGGPRSNRDFLHDLAAGRFDVPCLEPADYGTVAALNDRYAALDAGLTDLSIVVMAARYGTTRILTFDQRHFRTLRPLHGGTFVLVPFDEPIPPQGRT